jgi:hypothetical protein
MSFKPLVPIYKKWHLAFKIIPTLIVIVILKILFHTLGWELISLNALFTSIIAATTFLIGFLISGVISDYKESEKLPNELAASLEAIHDEIYLLQRHQNSQVVQNFMAYYKDFVASVELWFYKKERMRNMLSKLHQMNDHLYACESLLSAGSMTRLKNEQGAIRKLMLRLDTIRDTDFVPSAYAIVEALAFIVVVGLLFIKVDPFYESVFFTVIVGFLVSYMILLIKDLDNPFDYAHHGESGTEVSLKPIHDLSAKMLGEKKTLEK